MLRDILPKIELVSPTHPLLSPYSFRLKALCIIWLSVMISVPIALWTFGPQTTPYTLLLGVCLQSLIVLQLLSETIGHRRNLLIFIWVALLGWIAESIGTLTGFPFGVYEYTDLLKPQINHVPLLIPLAWFMMLPISVALSQNVMGRYAASIRPRFHPIRYRVIGALIAAFIMTAWDLLLDPHMVAWGFWRWEIIGSFSFFGIPWSNYAGWLLVSFCMALPIYPISLKDSTLIFWAIYAVTCFLETFGQLFFWGLIGPALIGGLLMGFITWVTRPNEIATLFSQLEI